MDLAALPVLTSLSDCVTLVQKDQVNILRVTHPKANAAIALHGGHVISFQPTGQTDLLWMSEKALWNGTTALRGGIPVCWPWFSSIATPSHGFARTSEWTLIEHTENEQGVIITLGLESNESTLSLWPYQFQLCLHVEISEQLTVSLIMHNTDNKPWAFSGALHSYLQVGDIAQAKITGMGSSYLDSLQKDASLLKGKACHGNDALVLTDTIDRVYTDPEATVYLHDPLLQRVIGVTNEGHNAAVLWNPWDKGANAIADMSHDGYKTMFCIESTLYAPSLAEGQIIDSGESYTLSTTLSSSPAFIDKVVS